MAQKNRKVPNTKRRATLGRLLVCASVFVLMLTLVVLAVLCRPEKAPPPVVYEEIHSASSELIGQINRIDQAVYESLYREGISEKDVLFLTAEPRHQRGMEWEFTEILVRVPEGARVRDLEHEILKDLSTLGEDIQPRSVRASGGDSVIDLFATGFFTHRVRLASREKQEEVETGKLPRIAIIIDDLGYDLEIARSFMEMDIPLTLSILPKAPHAVSIAKRGKERGCELILHLPMEPKNYPQVNPGPGAILAEMDDEAITETIEAHLRHIPGIRGVNNHMGSRLTELEDRMSVVFQELKRRNLFYVDSRTTARSVAVRLGQRMGVAVSTRGIFLDNRPSTVRFQIERLLGMARSSTSAIAIGHPHRETLNGLRDSLEKIKRNAKVVPVSEILLHPDNGLRARAH